MDRSIMGLQQRRNSAPKTAKVVRTEAILRMSALRRNGRKSDADSTRHRKRTLQSVAMIQPTPVSRMVGEDMIRSTGEPPSSFTWQMRR